MGRELVFDVHDGHTEVGAQPDFGEAQLRLEVGDQGFDRWGNAALQSPWLGLACHRHCYVCRLGLVVWPFLLTWMDMIDWTTVLGRGLDRDLRAVGLMAVGLERDFSHPLRSSRPSRSIFCTAELRGPLVEAIRDSIANGSVLPSDTPRLGIESYEYGRL